MPLLFVVLFISFLINLEFAQAKAVQINPGLIFSSQQVRRGVLVWDAPILIGGPSFLFFDVLALRGQDGLSLQFQGDIHEYRVGLGWFDDSAPQGPVIELAKREEDYKNLRKATFESYFTYTYNRRGFFSFRLNLNKDLKENGHYFSIAPNISPLPLWRVGTELGFANEAQNRYLYGDEGRGGIGHYDFFTSYMIPWLLPKGGILIMRYTRSQIAQGVNRHSFYTRGVYKHDTFFTGAFWRL